MFTIEAVRTKMSADRSRTARMARPEKVGSSDALNKPTGQAGGHRWKIASLALLPLSLAACAGGVQPPAIRGAVPAGGYFYEGSSDPLSEEVRPLVTQWLSEHGMRARPDGAYFVQVSVARRPMATRVTSAAGQPTADTLIGGRGDKVAFILAIARKADGIEIFRVSAERRVEEARSVETVLRLTEDTLSGISPR